MQIWILPTEHTKHEIEHKKWTYNNEGDKVGPVPMITHSIICLKVRHVKINVELYTSDQAGRPYCPVSLLLFAIEGWTEPRAWTNRVSCQKVQHIFTHKATSMTVPGKNDFMWYSPSTTCSSIPPWWYIGTQSTLRIKYCQNSWCHN